MFRNKCDKFNPTIPWHVIFIHQSITCTNRAHMISFDTSRIFCLLVLCFRFLCSSLSPPILGSNARLIPFIRKAPRRIALRQRSRGPSPQCVSSRPTYSPRQPHATVHRKSFEGYQWNPWHVLNTVTLLPPHRCTPKRPYISAPNEKGSILRLNCDAETFVLRRPH